MLFYVDTYSEAKSYFLKRRKYPVNYCEDDEKKTRRRRNKKPTDIAKVKMQLKIKLERITLLKKAVRVLNRHEDNRRMETIDDDDLHEFENLLEEQSDRDDEVPMNIEQIEASSAHLSMNNDTDDLILVNDEPHLTPSGIVTGIDPIEVDTEFSREYSFTTDVCSFDNFFHEVVKTQLKVSHYG